MQSRTEALLTEPTVGFQPGSCSKLARTGAVPAMALFARTRSPLLRSLLFGFLAGFVSTLTFHQITIALLAALGALQASAYTLQPVPPLGDPTGDQLGFLGRRLGLCMGPDRAACTSQRAGLAVRSGV